MIRILDAIYENGTFRPLGDTKGIGEHAHARVLICDAESASKRSELRGTLTREEALQQMGVIDAEFGQVEVCRSLLGTPTLHTSKALPARRSL